MSESAFPIIANDYVLSGGMKLRDYFAAKAMQSLLSNELHRLSYLRMEEADLQMGLVALLAYKTAQRMMDEKEKQDG